MRQTEKVWFRMSEGGGDIAPYHGFDAKMPAEVKAKVEQVRADIMEGRLVLEPDLSLPESD